MEPVLPAKVRPELLVGNVPAAVASSAVSVHVAAVVIAVIVSAIIVSAVNWSIVLLAIVDGPLIAILVPCVAVAVLLRSPVFILFGFLLLVLPSFVFPGLVLAGPVLLPGVTLARPVLLHIAVFHVAIARPRSVVISGFFVFRRFGRFLRLGLVMILCASWN